MLTPVRELFGIDTRSLAVFRIALGLAILADLLIKVPDLAAFYTDDGVLPRALLAEQVGARAPALLPILNLVPHVAFDGVPGQALLFVLAGAVAVLLIVGWQTRWVTIASWVLLTSLQARNPAVRNAGDDLFRLLLFWSLFLPLGATWSVDARNSPRAAAPRLVTGGAPAALLLQIAIIYPVNALYKTGAAWTTDFSALELFLANDVWGNVLGQRLLEHPGLLKAMTVLTIGLERFGVLLAFSPLWHGPARTVAVAMFATFHGGILVLSEIDLFAFIGLTAWTVFLPGWFWTSMVGWRHAQPADRAPLRQSVPRLQGAVALALLGYVGFLNAAGLGDRFGLGDRVPTALRAPALALQLDQEWSMFSPEPAPGRAISRHAERPPPGCRSTSSQMCRRAAHPKLRLHPRAATRANAGVSTYAT